MAEEWLRVCDALAEAVGTARREHEERLYALARETGVAALRGRWKYDEDVAMELVHDVLMRSLEQIVRAEHPRALFLWILNKHAINTYRRHSRELAVGEVPESAPRHEAPRTESSLELNAVIGLLRSELSPRDLRVFIARCFGASSKEVAAAEGLSVANVDKIVSRARARLKELLDADSE